MQPLDLLRVFIDPLEKSGHPYMITGSVAAIFYGAPRVTHDVDLILDIPRSQAAAFSELFPIAEFYCPPLETIESEILRGTHGHFNLIHHDSAFKADIYLAKDWLHKWGMERRVRFDQGEFPVWVAPLEYVIVRKLEFFTEGGSEKHLSDIQKMLAVEGEGVDRDWIVARVSERGLDQGWRRIRPSP